MCCVWISEQTATFALYSINRLVFKPETQCVHCAVRNESLHKADMFCILIVNALRDIFPRIIHQVSGSTVAVNRVMKNTNLFFCITLPFMSQLNPICHLLALLGAHHIFHVSGLRVKLLCYYLRCLCY